MLLKKEKKCINKSRDIISFFWAYIVFYSSLRKKRGGGDVEEAALFKMLKWCMLSEQTRAIVKVQQKKVRGWGRLCLSIKLN